MLPVVRFFVFGDSGGGGGDGGGGVESRIEFSVCVDGGGAGRGGAGPGRTVVPHLPILAVFVLFPPLTQRRSALCRTGPGLRERE